VWGVLNLGISVGWANALKRKKGSLFGCSNIENEDFEISRRGRGLLKMSKIESKRNAIRKGLV
jgi:hypothetical protein